LATKRRYAVATWDDVRSYVSSKWPITGETDGFVAIEFSTGEGRSQMTGIRLIRGGTEPRIRLESQVGWEGDIDPAAALRMNAKLPLGAIAVDEDERLLYAHSMMLRALDVDAIDIALRTLAVYGDKLEQRLSPDDLY
jgi:hypothetical protein